jgi:hypothetical protein
VFDAIRLSVFNIIYHNEMIYTKNLLYLVIYDPHPLLVTVSVASCPVVMTFHPVQHLITTFVTFINDLVNFLWPVGILFIMLT